MDFYDACLSYLIALLCAPFLFGVINRTKAIFGGRQGQPLLQPYYDLIKLLRKGAVYSNTTTWVFRAGPIVGMACVFTALALVPAGVLKAPLAFAGDFILVAYLLGLMRFFLVVAALDTGSSFEGMGASREVQFAALAEPAFLLSLVAIAKLTGSLSLSDMFIALGTMEHIRANPVIWLVAVAMLLVFLAENSRIPVDDPNTHLELTMIHEVMVLDHSGPDFAYILYAAALKFWVLGSLLVSAIISVQTTAMWLNMVIFLAGMLGLAILVGIIESSMARLRLVRVPQMLVGAGTLALLALIWELR